MYVDNLILHKVSTSKLALLMIMTYVLKEEN